MTILKSVGDRLGEYSLLVSHTDSVRIWNFGAPCIDNTSFIVPMFSSTLAHLSNQIQADWGDDWVPAPECVAAESWNWPQDWNSSLDWRQCAGYARAGCYSFRYVVSCHFAMHLNCVIVESVQNGGLQIKNLVSLSLVHYFYWERTIGLASSAWLLLSSSADVPIIVLRGNKALLHIQHCTEVPAQGHHFWWWKWYSHVWFCQVFFTFLGSTRWWRQSVHQCWDVFCCLHQLFNLPFWV